MVVSWSGRRFGWGMNDEGCGYGGLWVYYVVSLPLTYTQTKKIQQRLTLRDSGHPGFCAYFFVIYYIDDP